MNIVGSLTGITKLLFGNAIDRTEDNLVFPSFYQMERFLTSEELESIKKALPDDKVVRDVIERLGNIQIKPNKIPQLVHEVIKSYYKSRASAGEAVGILAATSIGEPTTQMTLNSVAFETLILYKNNGVICVKPIGELIDTHMVGDIKHFPENNTEYKEVTGFEVPTVDSSGKMSWGKITAFTRHLPGGDLRKVTTQSGKTVTVTKSKSLLVWNGDKLVQIRGSEACIGDLLPSALDFEGVEHIRDLHGYTVINDVVLDPVVKIEIVPESEHPFVYDLTVPSTTNFCIFNGLNCADTFHHAGHGSLSLAGVPRMNEIMNATENPKQPVTRVYFHSHPKSIKDLPYKYDIQEVKLHSLIDSSKVMNKPEDGWYYLYEELFRDIPEDAKCIRLFLNKEKMFRHRVTTMDLYRTIDGTSHSYNREVTSIDDVTKRKLTIKLWVVPGPLSTEQAIIDVYTRMDTALSDREIGRQSRELVKVMGEIHIKGVPGVYDAYYSSDKTIDGEWFIQAVGNREMKPNFIDLLGLPGVDPTRTVTDDLREIEKTLGIEAARTFLVKEIRRVISAGVNSAHFKLLADAMTYNGGLTSISRFGTDPDEQGPLSLMTFEQTLTHIVNAAQYEVSDKLNGVSGSIITGRLAPIGTGSMGMHLDFGALMYSDTIVDDMKKAGPETEVKERPSIDELFD